MPPRKFWKIFPPDIEFGAVTTENYKTVSVANSCGSAGHL